MLRKNSGAVFITCLNFLMILTILGLATMGNTSLQIKMAHRSLDYQIAFQRAESALHYSEQIILSQNESNAGPVKPCHDMTESEIKDIEMKPFSWWKEFGCAISSTTPAFNSLYVITEVDSPQPPNTRLFLTYAYGTGRNKITRVLLERSFAITQANSQTSNSSASSTTLRRLTWREIY